MSYKVKYTLRKSRSMGTLLPVMFGVVFGGVILSSTTTYASDTINTTENPATNAIEAQPLPLPEAAVSHSKANQYEGELNVSPNSIALDEAVQESQAQGLLTELTSTINQGGTSDIKAIQQKQIQIELDYQDQVENIKNTVINYQQQVKNYQEKQTQVTLENANKKEQYRQQIQQHNEEVNKINTANQQQQQAYQHALEVYNNELNKINDFNKKQEKQYQQAYQLYSQNKDKIIKINKQQQEAYNQAIQQYEQQLANYQQQQQQYETALQQYNKSVKEINKKNKDLLVQYDLKCQEINKKQLEIDRQNEQALIQYRQKVEKAKQAIANGFNNPTTVVAADGENGQYSASQSWTNLKSKVIDSDIHIVRQVQLIM